MTRQEKLDQLKESKASKDMVIISNGEPFIEVLGDKIKELKTVLGVGVELNNLDELVKNIGGLQSLQTEVLELNESIKAIDIPGEITIGGLSDLITATNAVANKKFPQPIIQKLDVSAIDNITNAIGKLTDKIEKLKAPKQGQRAGDYVPMRRVVKVDGIGLMYDDSFYTGGGGGGAGQAVPTMLYQPITQAGAGSLAIAGGVAGKRIKVTNYAVVLGGAGTVQFFSDAGAITGAMSFAANGGVSVGGTEFAPAFQTGVGEGLNMTTTGSSGNGHISYFLE